MKQHILTLLVLTFLALNPTGVIYAENKEADATAKLMVEERKTGENDQRVKKLTNYLASQDSPLTAEAGHFVSEADRVNMDWKLVAAIAGVESTFGKFTPHNSYNGWGWGIPTGAASGIAFRNWKEGITSVTEGLKYNYINKGATSIEQIGRIYAASPAWSWKVHYFLNQIDTFAPAKPELIEVTL